MKYLKGTDRFTWTNDEEEEKPFVIEKDGEKHDASVAETLLQLTRAYVPTQGQMLSLDEIDHLQRAKRILAKPPQENGYHRFETEHWNVLTKVVRWVLPQVNLYFVAPEVVQILNGAKDKPEVEPGSQV